MRGAALAGLLLVLAACLPSGDRATEPTPSRGGVLRVEAPVLDLDANLDPTNEYTSFGFALFSNLLLRPLMNYRHVAGEPGNEVLPDLAAEMPEISGDGLTYTFTLRDGVRFGPPLGREITSEDVAYAFERLADPTMAAPYAFYYSSVIAGFAEVEEGRAVDISGIETPDEDTIRFHLLRPTGDFLYRLALPAAAPIPEEVASCFPDGGYGRRLVASGPYMIEGSEDLDSSSCEEIDPLAGFRPRRSLAIVRNPNHDPGTEDPELRSAHLNGVTVTVEPDAARTIERIESGKVDLSTAAPSVEVLRTYTASPRLLDNLHVEAGDRLWYISMNLTIPPFDDVHVRRAVNLVMDRDSLLRSWGGPLRGEVATHVLPDKMLNDALTAYDPYPSRNHAGDTRAARAEMRLSRYDSDGDGLCDAAACSRVAYLTRPQFPWSQMDGAIDQSLAKIGLDIDARASSNPYEPLERLPTRVAITSVPGWVKDYPDPFSFIGFLLDGRNINADANTNYSLVGLTREQAGRLDIRYPRGGVPSVDSDIDRCSSLTDDDERRACWTELDRKLMEEVVPWVPYLEANHLLVVSDAVEGYAYDQFSGEISFAHVSVDRNR